MNKTETTRDLTSEVTMVLDKDAAPLPRSAEQPESPAASVNFTSTVLTKDDILNALSDLIFPSRNVVDDTIALPGEDAPQSEKEHHTQKLEGKHLRNVRESYNIAEPPFASGGQGSISKASDIALGCEVAVKSLNKKHCSNENSRNEFYSEAQLTATLDHPSIIPIHGIYGDDDNGIHLAMKLINGYTLKEYLENISKTYEKKGIRHFDEKRSLRNRIDIFLRVCDAIDYAHSRGIIHCDLKPENIMLGKHRETYVTDWGIARYLEDAAHLEKVNGTPGYIAPEMLLEKRADERSDIYSLGLILFEIVALTPAFIDNELPILLNKVKQGMHEPLKHHFRCRIEPDLAAIVLKAINRNPDERYQTIEALSLDLQHYLANEEVSAHPDNIITRLSRWGVNHRRGMMLSMLLLMLLGASSLTFTLTREITSNIEKQQQDQAVHNVYSNVIETANHIEKQIRHIEYTLELLKLNTLLATQQKSSSASSDISFFVPLERYKNNPPKSLLYSKAYQYKVDPYGVCVFDYHTGKSVSESLLHKFAPAAEKLQAKMLSFLPDTKEENSVDKLYEATQPAKTLYIAMEDGIFACYPGIADIPNNFKPNTRDWYKQAAAHPEQMQWSSPYSDASGHKEMVITCSTAITDTNGKVIGVVAADFSMPRLSEFILSSGQHHTNFICEKMMIDHTGKVVFRKKTKQDSQTADFDDQQTIKRMLLMKHGSLAYKSENGERLLVFSYIKSLKILYVECLDMQKLVESNRTSGKSAK